METSKTVYLKTNEEQITKRELESLLTMLEYGQDCNNVNFSCGYIKEIIKLAISSFNTKLI